jgi:acetylornithine/succinyldiaminopimelate/putrescine aminotransferase
MTKAVGQWLFEQGWGYVSTFGGAEPGCVVAAKVLEICRREEVLAGVNRLAALLAAGFRDLLSRHSFLKAVRQKGLVIGLETDGALGGMQLSRTLYRRGIWAMFSGFDPSVLQFKPGLLIDDAYVTELLERLDAGLTDAAKETH